ncbi:hypothetical protein [Corynebacterium sp. A21]|uniref:hypothetical protein n=1 Tax=Corynebacterium sp. A21 TaxID=3457318 RepID=UPI003FD517C7
MNWRDFGIIGVVLLSTGLIVAQLVRPVEPEYPYAHQGPRSPNTAEYVTDGPSFAAVRALVEQKVSHYRGKYQDGTLQSFAPDGETVDLHYNQAFLALLIDIKSSMGIRSYWPRPEGSVWLIETEQKVLELERRFLAGEELGAIVYFETMDGSVLVLDGIYAGEAPTFSPERREIRLWDSGTNERDLQRGAPTVAS